MLSLSEGPQQSAPTAVALAATAPAAEAVTGTSVFPAALAGMVAGAPAAAGTRGVTTSAPAVAGSICGSVFTAASAGMMAGAPAAAGTRGVATSAPAVAGSIGGSVFPAASAGMMAGAPAAAGTRVVALTAAPSTGDTAAPDASVERAARKLTLEAGSSSKICSERGASTHPFEPGTVFPLEVRYYNSSWPKHGSNSNSSSSSSSSGNGSSRSSNDTTSNHDSWRGATCVGALLRPFDPGKQCRRDARRVKTVIGLNLPFDRGRAWRRMQHGGWRASC